VIVAIAHAGDAHAAHVLDALRRRGEEPFLLDLSDYPARSRIALRYGAARRWVLETPAGSVAASDVTAVWRRRPAPHAPAPEVDAALRPAWEALAGLAASLDVLWVNDPWLEAAACHEPFQLATAERAGLDVPATLVTSDLDAAREFLAAAGAPVIRKALLAVPGGAPPSRFVGPGDVERLALPLAPVVLQEYVPGVDVRVTAIGDALHAVAIDARATRSPEDFRPVFAEATVEPWTLPPAAEARLRSLLSSLGLRYAAVSLRRRDDGTLVFLEVDPSGEWLFVEERTGLPLTEAVARVLTGR
jgi:glutathione synthase/RimK-type ligase-like ATP-grasp enzyme